jgi:homocysteine S-methyltransferase
VIPDPFAAYPGAVVLDGGLATELERRGADLRDPLWSARVLVEDPERIVEVHRAYVEAGADVVISASYQASFDGLAARGFDLKAAAALLRRSVELAREATDAALRPVVVAASIGPYGAFLANGAEYTGDYGLGAPTVARDALRAFHLPRAEALAAADPDLFAIETIPSLVETEALVQVLDAIGMPAWVSFSCADEGHLHDGTSIEEAVGVASSSPYVVAVGVNCTPPAAVPSLLARAATVTSTPLVAYPNQGATWDPGAKAWTGDAVPDGFGPLARGLRDAGARLIGGCCGTGPADIADVASALHG